MRLLSALNQFFSSRLGALATNALVNQRFQRQWEEARQRNLRAEQRGYNQLGLMGDAVNAWMPRMYGQLETLGTQLGQGYNQLAGQTVGQLGDLRGQLQRGYRQLGAQAQQQVGQLQGSLQGGYGALQSGLTGAYQRGAAGITGGYGAMRSEAMGMLSGMGAQARQDILRRHSERRASVLGSLEERGLTGSSVLGAAERGLMRGQEAELGRLDETLRNQRLGLYTGLTGAGLSARERFLGGGTQLGAGLGLAGLASQQQVGGMGLQAATGLGLAGLGAQQQLGGMGLQTMSNLGLAGLASQQQLGGMGLQLGQLGLQSQLGVGQQYLDFVQGIQNPYPGQPAQVGYY